MIEHKVIGEQPTMRFGLTGIESIKQNIQVIATTFAGTVPLDRAFGISAEVLDQPFLVSQALLVNELTEAITEGEPRAVVTSITFETSQEDAEQGKLVPIIKFVEKGVEQ